MNFTASRPPGALEGEFSRTSHPGLSSTGDRCPAAAGKQMCKPGYAAARQGIMARPGREEHGFEQAILLWILNPSRALKAVDSWNIHSIQQHFQNISSSQGIVRFKFKDGATWNSCAMSPQVSDHVHSIEIQRHGQDVFASVRVVISSIRRGSGRAHGHNVLRAAMPASGSCLAAFLCVWLVRIFRVGVVRL